MTVSFRDSAKDTKQEISHRVHQVCEHCHGNTAEPGTPIETCETCKGQGAVSATRQTALGVFSQNVVCPKCEGEGKIAKTPCSKCSGEGRQLRNRKLSIDIPAGIADGQAIRITGKGEVPVGGSANTAGDLYVTVHVSPEKNLTRRGDDIFSEIKIPYTDAILGTTVTTKTLSEDKATVAIAPGTQPGDEIRLNGQGFPEIGSTTATGDHVITVNITIPKKVTRPQKKLLQELKETSSKRRLFT